MAGKRGYEQPAPNGTYSLTRRRKNGCHLSMHGPAKFEEITHTTVAQLLTDRVFAYCIKFFEFWKFGNQFVDYYVLLARITAKAADFLKSTSMVLYFFLE